MVGPTNQMESNDYLHHSQRFCSLYRFKMDISRGLNILVGPNGSGKTNIIMFFEFLSHLCTSQLGRIGLPSGDPQFQSGIARGFLGRPSTEGLPLRVKTRV